MYTIKSLKVIGITCTQVGMDLNEKANSKWAECKEFP